MNTIMKKLLLLIGLASTIGSISAMNNGIQDDLKIETKICVNVDVQVNNSDIKAFTEACDQNDLDRVKSILKRIPIPKFNLRLAAYCLPEDEPVNETQKFLHLMYYFLYHTTRSVDMLKHVLAKENFIDFMPRRLETAVLEGDADIVVWLIETQQFTQETLEQVLLIALRQNLDPVTTILNTKLDQLNPVAPAAAQEQKSNKPAKAHAAVVNNMHDTIKFWRLL